MREQHGWRDGAFPAAQRFRFNKFGKRFADRAMKIEPPALPKQHGRRRGRDNFADASEIKDRFRAHGWRARFVREVAKRLCRENLSLGEHSKRRSRKNAVLDGLLEHVTRRGKTLANGMRRLRHFLSLPPVSTAGKNGIATCATFRRIVLEPGRGDSIYDRRRGFDSQVQEYQEKSGPESSRPAGAESAEPHGNPQSFVWQMWTRDLLVSVLVAFFIITFVFQPVRVEGTSMMPELQDQERIFINKFEYHFEPIRRGDVIVFHYPRDPVKSYIKRVIAIPGDDLRILDGQVYVNGKPLAEPYVLPRYQDERSYPDRVLKAGQYFVMGDHRSISSDSRDFGPVNRSLIYGKASFVYWPADEMGVVR